MEKFLIQLLIFSKTLMRKKLNLEQVLSMSGLKPNYELIKPLSCIKPGLIPSSYVPEINYFTSERDALFYGLYAEKERGGVKDLIFYSPSVDLITTLMLRDEQGVKKVLGINDGLVDSEKCLINDIINALKNPNSYVKKKGLGDILSSKRVHSGYYSGHAGNGRVDSKSFEKTYDDVFKQLVRVEGDELVMPDSLEAVCTCGLNLFSKTKYEFNNLIMHCHHLKALFRSFKNADENDSVRLYEEPRGQELENIDNIFSPFSPLENPEHEGKFLRRIIRKGLENFIITHQPFLKNEEFRETYKSNGYTWNRVELDAYLLSFKEVYDNKLLEWFNSFHNIGESFKKTSLLFGDVSVVDLKESSADHVFNHTKKKWEHGLNNNWYKIEHALKNKKTGEVFIRVNEDYYVSLNNDLKRYILRVCSEVDDNRVEHDKGFNHVCIDKSLTLDKDYEIIHLEKVYNITRTSYSQPFKVAELPSSVLLYPGPYQFRKI